MALEPVQQLEEILKKSKNILILLPQSPSYDTVSAGWSFYFFLKKTGAEPTIAFSDPFKSKDRFNFLPRPKNISDTISGARDFIISFNTLRNKISNARVVEKKDELRIYITPEQGSIDPRDFSFIPAKFKFDLVIVIGSPDKESLGKIYEENPDIFYEVPVVNIDCRNSNDNFGQINIVDITASSTCEILAEIFERINPSLLDEDIANCLLTGIISATGSFQKKNTTPKALQLSARLMDKGGDQQRIIRHLYKTQPLHLLKLWGRIMSRVKWDENLKLVWSLVSLEDFVQSHSKPSDIPLVLEKIKDNYSSGKIFMVLFNETPDIVKGMLRLSEEKDLKKLAASLKLEGEIKGNLYEFQIKNSDIIAAEKTVLEKIKSLEE